MTRRNAGLSALYPEEHLEIHPQDAAQLQISEGQMVEVASRRGKVNVPAHLTDRCTPGVIFMSFHFEETPTNELTGDLLDAMACTPEYKVTAVRATPVAMS
jgi:predicted molibdopterin-dependent oxidoreductase YjgC